MAYGRKSLTQVMTSEIFYQMPKVLIGTEYYKKLLSEAKLLYMLIDDRLKLSIKSAKESGKFVDKNGDVFVIYPNDELCSDMGIGKDKVIKLKKELIKYNLLDEERQGLNQPNRLYPKNVIADPEVLAQSFEKLPKPHQYTEVGNSEFRISEIQSSGFLKFRNQEVGNSESSNNDLINNDLSKKNISSRKSSKNSIEFSSSAEADNQSTFEKSEKYIEPQYYSLLNVIADVYNGKFCQQDLFTGEFQNYSLTHKQKMLIGQYLNEGYVSSKEVENIIDRIPIDCESPLAYLLRSLENLKEERRLESKILAHRKAEMAFAE
ncbi:TPA: replication initiator protein A [Streptococcus agalactiae]